MFLKQRRKIKSKNNQDHLFKSFWNIISNLFFSFSHLCLKIIELVLYILLILLFYNVFLIFLSKKKKYGKWLFSILYGNFIAIFWGIVFFSYFWYHSLANCFFQNGNINQFPFSFILKYKLIHHFPPILIYGFFAIVFFTMLFNSISLIIFSQTIGQIITKQKIIFKNTIKNKNNKLQSNHSFTALFLYILLCWIIIATIFIWPIFFIIIFLFFFYYVFTKQNLLLYLTQLKVVDLKKNEENFLKKFLNTFHFYFSKPPETKLQELTWKSSKSLIGSKIEKNFQKISNNIAIYEYDNKNSLQRIITNTINLNNFFINNGVLLSQLMNSIIYITCFCLSMFYFGIYNLIGQLKIFTKMIGYYFVHANSSLFLYLTKNNFHNLFFRFYDNNHILLSNFIGYGGNINLTINNINYSLSYINHLHSFANFVNNLQFIMWCLIFNFRYSPETSIAWVLLFLIAIWFFINLAFIILFGNTFFGLIISNKRLVYADSKFVLSFWDRCLYSLFFIFSCFFFFVPIINIFWILINIVCYINFKSFALNVFLNYCYDNVKKQSNYKLLKTIQIVNAIFIFIKQQMIKSFVVKKA